MKSDLSIGKDLQQQNFKEILQKMAKVPGWRILEDEKLLALIAPSTINFVNYVWGDTTLANIQKVKRFYQNTPFTWLVKPLHNEDNLKSNNFALDELVSTEMVLCIDEYLYPVIPSNIKITTPKTDSELQIWTNTAIATFAFSSREFSEFFYPLIKFANCIPFLIMYNNQPAATAMVYCGNNVAGVYAMSTREEYRHKGCAVAAVNACISLAKVNKLELAVLYSSDMGKLLYKKLGFKETQILQEYNFKNEKN